MKQNDKAKLERRRNTGIASNKTSTQAYLSTTEEHRNHVYREEQQWKRTLKANTFQDKIKETGSQEHQDDE